MSRSSALDSLFSRPTLDALEPLIAGPPGLWVTDADRTLWANDIGEGFLRALQMDGVLVAPDAQGDAWATYVGKVRQNESQGYVWAAQAMAGLLEAEVRTRARRFADAFVSQEGFEAFRELIRELQARDWEVWVVSASNQWIVEAGARLMGVAPERVIGIRVEIEGGRLTDQPLLPVPNRAGKVDAIQKHIGRRPTLVSGDSYGDLSMLEWAERLPLVVQAPTPRDASFAACVRARGWVVETLGAPSLGSDEAGAFPR